MIGHRDLVHGNVLASVEPTVKARDQVDQQVSP